MSEKGARTFLRAAVAELLRGGRNLNDGSRRHARERSAEPLAPPRAQNSVVPSILNTGPWPALGGGHPADLCRPSSSGSDGIRAKSRPFRASSARRRFVALETHESPGTIGTGTLLWALSLPNKGLRYCYEAGAPTRCRVRQRAGFVAGLPSIRGPLQEPLTFAAR